MPSPLARGAVRIVTASRLRAEGSAGGTILVPVDFSRRSERALRHAALMAERQGCSIILLHVVEADPFLIDLHHLPLAKAKAELLDEAETRLNRFAAKRLPATQPRLEIVRYGRVAPEIVRTAREERCHRIVFAADHPGALNRMRRWLFGSTAAWVKRHAPCPVVLLVPHRRAARRFVRTAASRIPYEEAV
ncbi:MAG TPA: universal stress protein [Lacunisphaera sp.]|nr:universal stress protein [Lacunisphaera sp.]